MPCESRRPVMGQRARSVALLLCTQTHILPVKGWGCEWWCGQWACPGDFCNDCGEDRCAWTDTASGSPPGHVSANFEAPWKRQAPKLWQTGEEVPACGRSGDVRTCAPETYASAHPVPFDVTSAGHEFTPFHLGTNFPLYTPWEMAHESLAPTLAAAGILVWRWPGGAATNFWCPTGPNENWVCEGVTQTRRRACHKSGRV